MIRVVHPGSRIRMLTFSHPGSRGQKAPNPQHCFKVKNNDYYISQHRFGLKCHENNKRQIFITPVHPF